jgi:N-methylhydantoinase A
MVQAIEEITLKQGIDPANAVIVAGGGGAGLYAAGIARRLGCKRTVVPPVSAALSAMGELLSELQRDFQTAGFTTTGNFDTEVVSESLRRLDQHLEDFGSEVGLDGATLRREYAVEARYPNQVWEIEVRLGENRFADSGDVEGFRQSFHAAHRELFAVEDVGSEVEILTWRARATGSLRPPGWSPPPPEHAAIKVRPGSRRVYFGSDGFAEAQVRSFDDLSVGSRLAGPAIVESPVTSIVVEPGVEIELLESGSLLLHTPDERGADIPVAASPGAER